MSEEAFFEFSTNHSLPLFGFHPDRTNEITVSVTDRNHNSITAFDPVNFVTAQLPNDFPNITLLQSEPTRMEPGYSLFVIDAFGSTSQLYAVIVDSKGEVVWYNTPPSGFELRQLSNGNLFSTWSTSFAETDLFGNLVQSWNAPVLPVNVHEGVPTPHGSILYLSDALDVVQEIPLAGIVGPVNVLYQNVVEISATDGTLLNTWSPISILDPERISYLLVTATDGLSDDGYDTEHSNAITEDPSDDSLIVSMRNQNAVVKFSRLTGRLIWILGPHENWGPQWWPYLLTPVGSPFQWQYGQHAPLLTSRGTLLLYDDGNYRSSPPETQVDDQNNYSRAVEYKIDEQKMEVSQVWQYGSASLGSWFYTGFEGNAEPEPLTGNVLIDFAAVTYIDGSLTSPLVPNAVAARIREVTHDPIPDVVFDLAITSYDKADSQFWNSTVYRVHRIPDLYPHPLRPVQDLIIRIDNDTPHLFFSGDRALTYRIESSENLTDWQPLGSPVEDELQTGEYQYSDSRPRATLAGFYRVTTE